MSRRELSPALQQHREELAELFGEQGGTRSGWVGLESLLTRDEVAEILRADSPKTVDQLRRDGKLRGVKVGRSWRYDRRDVQVCVDGLRGVTA